MSEKIVSKTEHEIPSIESEAIHEQREKISEKLESEAEKAPKQSIETAKQEALEQAKSIEKESSSEADKAVEKRQPQPRKRNKKMLDQSFTKQMKEARQDMAAPSKAFSKLIHAKPVEMVSEAVGSTIARPNAILAGSLSAFILVSFVYVVAKYIGYPLSGFETIAAFILGWLVGTMIDFFRIMITGKR